MEDIMGRQPLEYEQHQLYIKLKETAEPDGTIANIDDIVASLPYTRKQTITYNRTRQAMITKELIEIISGAEAL